MQAFPRAAASPKKMKKLARRTHKRSDLLGDDHDLAELRNYMATHRQCFDGRVAQVGAHGGDRPAQEGPAARGAEPRSEALIHGAYRSLVRSALDFDDQQQGGSEQDADCGQRPEEPLIPTHVVAARQRPLDGPLSHEAVVDEHLDRE
jgi:hypothetical protein